jgi:hypothetical protein
LVVIGLVSLCFVLLTQTADAVEVCSCVGRGGVVDVHFWGPKNGLCNDQNGWGPYAQNCKQVTEVCSCVGRGSVQGVRLYGPKSEACGGFSDWGKYEFNCVELKSESYCSDVAHGDKLENQALWGPKGFSIGGNDSWGTYQSRCVRD